MKGLSEDAIMMIVRRAVGDLDRGASEIAVDIKASLNEAFDFQQGFGLLDAANDGDYCTHAVVTIADNHDWWIVTLHLIDHDDPLALDWYRQAA